MPALPLDTMLRCHKGDAALAAYLLTLESCQLGLPAADFPLVTLIRMSLQPKRRVISGGRACLGCGPQMGSVADRLELV